MGARYRQRTGAGETSDRGMALLRVKRAKALCTARDPGQLVGGGDRNRTGVQGFAGCSGRILADLSGKKLLVRRGARTSANTGEPMRPGDGRGMESVAEVALERLTGGSGDD